MSFGPYRSPGSRYINPKLRLAHDLQQRALDSSPVQHWAQGLARLGNAFAARNLVNKDQEMRQAWGDKLQTAMGSGDPQAAMDALLQGVNSDNPYEVDAAGKLMQGRLGALLSAQAEQNKVRTVAPGSTLVRNGKPIYTAPAAKKPTPGRFGDYQRAKAAGAFTGSYEDYLRMGRGSTSIKVEAPLVESEADKQFGKAQGEQAASLMGASDQATTQLERVNVITNLLDTYEARAGELGPLSETKLGAGAFLQQVGINPSLVGIADPKSIGIGQAIIAQSNELALGKIGGEGGMPANNFSEADRNFITSTVPRITDSPEGARMKLEIARAIAQRKIEAAQKFDEFREGGDNIGTALRRVRKFYAAKPLLDESTKSQITGMVARVVIVNPETGARMELKDGKWVPFDGQ